MKPSRDWVILALSVASFLPSTFGQQAPAIAPPISPEASTPKQPSPDIVVTFVARDDHRRPVSDLKPGDVQIFENGKIQAVKDCKFAAARASATEHRELSLLVDSSASDSLALANEFAAGLADGAPGIEISVWDAKQLNAIQPFTSDLSTLQKAVAEAGQATPAALERESSTEVNPAMRDARWKVDNERCRPWLAALYALVKQQGMVSGRKEIVFFAANEDGGDVTESQIRALASNATRAGVSVYILEANALTPEAEASAAQIASGAKKRNAVKSAPQKLNLLRELAERTGGSYAVARASMQEFRHAVLEDLVGYYEITYTPDPFDFSGDFRSLAIKVSRPRTSVRHPSGYFSVPAVNAFDVAPFAPALLHALQTSGGRQDFPIEARILRFGRPEKVANTAVIVEIPLSAMHGETESSGEVSIHFSVLSLIKSADGKVVREIDQDIPYETKSQDAATYTFEGAVFLDPGEYHADVAVRDENSDRLSTRAIAFEVPTPAAEAKPGQLDLADIAVVRDAESGTAARRDGDPLRLGPTRILPYAGSSIGLAPGGMLPVFLTMYPDRAGLMPELDLEVQRDRVSIIRLPLLTSRDEAGRYRALVWLPQDTLSPGHYMLIARAVQGQETAERRTVFDLVPPGTVTDAVEISSARGPSETIDGGGTGVSSGAMSLLDESKLSTGGKKLDDAEVKRVLTGARLKALDYERDLPNFVCIASTKRFNGKAGQQTWRLKDSMAELLAYTSGTEQYETIEVNGHPQRLDRSDFSGVRVSGEFGELLDAVYSEGAAANFKIRGERRFDGVEVYVFEFEVPRKRSVYSLSTMYGHSKVYSAFRGVIFIDKKTLNTRYVSIQAEDVPDTAMYRESAVSVNYDYFAIGGRRFLLPKTATLTVRMGKHDLLKNEMQFRNYRRYESKSRLLP